MKCLHCGKNKANYCENCYQELITENMRLQLEVLNLRKALQYKAKHMKED